MAERSGRWTRTNRDVLHSGRFIRLLADTVEGPYAPPFRYEHIEVADAVRVVVLDRDRRILLVEDEFYCTGLRMPHLPGGGVEPGEAPEAAARRELEEETGWRAGRFQALGLVHPLPGSTGAATHLFLATDLRPGRMARDDTEAGMSVHRRPFAEALAMVDAGTVTEAGSVAALLRAARLLGTD
ncbi:NUDIX hydrolase [Kitasatospora camelliae]|uniref:NUDIX hydrolase n=1 Tax=Kitasatospora camelliae TaxID=3156397 RepID=A0AAU8K3C0_9ACTN